MQLLAYAALWWLCCAFLMAWWLKCELQVPIRTPTLVVYCLWGWWRFIPWFVTFVDDIERGRARMRDVVRDAQGELKRASRDDT